MKIMILKSKLILKLLIIIKKKLMHLILIIKILNKDFFINH